jgi:hypothetical protein
MVTVISQAPVLSSSILFTTVEDFRDFVFYANNKYGEKCSDCLSLTNNCPIHNCTDTTEKKKRKRKKKKKEKEVDSTKKCPTFI